MFIDDKEKMIDFFEMCKEEFLESYSYLTEEEYNATKLAVAKRIGLEDTMDYVCDKLGIIESDYGNIVLDILTTDDIRMFAISAMLAEWIRKEN